MDTSVKTEIEKTEVEVVNPVAEGEHAANTEAKTVVDQGLVGAIGELVKSHGGARRRPGKLMKKIRLRTLSGKYVEPIQTVRRSGPKVGRNDKCPCGSGKKNKVCCLPKLEAMMTEMRDAAEAKKLAAKTEKAK